MGSEQTHLQILHRRIGTGAAYGPRDHMHMQMCACSLDRSRSHVEHGVRSSAKSVGVQRVEVQSCAVAPTSNEPVYTIAMFRSDDVGTTVYKTYGDIMYVVSLVVTGVCEPTSHRTCGWAGCAAGSCILAFRLRGSAPCSVAWRWRR